LHRAGIIGYLFKVEHPVSQVTVDLLQPLTGRAEADQRLVKCSMVLLKIGVVLLEAGAVLLNAGVVLLQAGAVLLEAGVVLFEAGVPGLHLDKVGLQLLKLLADIDLCEVQLLFG
jgi:hypothetical protein